jgi:hypothetical protein
MELTKIKENEHNLRHCVCICMWANKVVLTNFMFAFVGTE